MVGRTGSIDDMGNGADADQMDLRLAVGAGAAWLAVLWGLSRPAGLAALAAGGCLVVGISVLGFVLLRPPAARDLGYPIAFGAFAMAMALAPLSVQLHQAHDSDLARLAAGRVEVTAELVVTADPRPLVARGPGGTARTAVEGRLTAVSIVGHRSAVTGSVLLLGPSDAWRRILPGQHVKVDARLSPPLARNLLTATLSARTDPELVGRPPWWQRGAGSIRRGLQRAAAPLPELPRGLLPGLVDGDTSQLDPVLAERFRVAGLTHLTAVSGTNYS